MLIPFMQGGIFLFSLSNVSLEVNDLLFRFKNDFGTVFQELGGVVLSGIAVWVLVAIPLFFLLFFIFHALLLRWMRREVKELT